ncbi:PspC domain-containing protein [Prevotella brunnea]|uniref:PspC domain-containing protein n=1 Tax=Prevotella brunnea TaxID=2508867 RepID=A0A5C8GLN7_9BACT|nr:PspC domain-containing protein [Prevotella brunnea]MDR0186686.1 PspC domain-containing protein [Prevotella brunnea]TXJ62846.1 PspC domain-containing protein [Prevotella brunnea]
MNFDTKRRLTRSFKDTKVAGVCGGIAKYLDLDSTAVRALYATLTLFSGAFPGILLYVILWAIMPIENEY